ncbi:hypothetical protein TNCT_546101 [Trichonephila clavata]|uniref:Uncharacterized protein n=1 Tax=Trichonephila clavata TaxID=2740835 RepID=A0A8X6LPC0_TRICU|nr:hypothetical protein TNCT_546101 [Trichonephila clavata]
MLSQNTESTLPNRIEHQYCNLFCFVSSSPASHGMGHHRSNILICIKTTFHPSPGNPEDLRVGLGMSLSTDWGSSHPRTNDDKLSTPSSYLPLERFGTGRERKNNYVQQKRGVRMVIGYFDQ